MWPHQARDNTGCPFIAHLRGWSSALSPCSPGDMTTCPACSAWRQKVPLVKAGSRNLPQTEYMYALDAPAATAHLITGRSASAIVALRLLTLIGCRQTQQRALHYRHPRCDRGWWGCLGVCTAGQPHNMSEYITHRRHTPTPTPGGKGRPRLTLVTSWRNHP